MVVFWMLGLAMALESVTWRVVNDTVMGGRSSASVEVRDNELIFRGTVSKENNGGFASIRSAEIVNLLGASGFEVDITGTEAPVQLTLWTGQGANLYYAQEVQLNSGVQDIRFSEFVAKSYGRRVSAPTFSPTIFPEVSVGVLVGGGFEGPFELSIRRLDRVEDSNDAPLSSESSLAQSTQQQIAQVLQRAIQRGVPLYNAGDASECAAIYQTALESILILTADTLPTPMQSAIRESLEQGATQGARERAWTHRRTMDALLSTMSAD